MRLRIHYSTVLKNAAFLNQKFAVFFYHNNRKLVIVDLERNLKVSEMQIHDEGNGTSIKVDRESGKLVVTVRDGVLTRPSSDWGFIYVYRVVISPDLTPILV